MANEGSTNLQDEFVEMLTPVGDGPNFLLLTPTPVPDSKHSNIQSVSVLSLPIVENNDVDQQNEEKKVKGDRKGKICCN